jgi:hypothetical protein
MMGSQPQWLRLLEVLVIGPYMIASARDVESPTVRGALVVAAAATIAFNAGDWLADFPARGFLGERSNGESQNATAAAELGRYARIAGAGGWQNPARCGCGH